jgi:hypothetical protein
LKKLVPRLIKWTMNNICWTLWETNRIIFYLQNINNLFLWQNLVLAFVSWNTSVNGSLTNDLRLVVTSCWTAPLLTKRVRIASREKGAVKIRVNVNLKKQPWFEVSLIWSNVHLNVIQMLIGAFVNLSEIRTTLEPYLRQSELNEVDLN